MYSTRLDKKEKPMKVRIIEPTKTLNSKCKRAYAYARVSPSGETGGESLENQTTYYKRGITDYAARLGV
jgi:hypothetical protein